MSKFFTNKSWIFWAFLLLMTLHLPLWGPFYTEDLLAPVIALFLLYTKNYKQILQVPNYLLGVALTGAAAMTAVHVFTGGENGYNLAVLIYMAGIFLCFQNHELSPTACLAWGGGILTIILIGYVADYLACNLFSVNLGLCYFGEDVAQSEHMGFLARRYSFIFGNPNVLGAFYVLPMLLFLHGLTPVTRFFNRRLWFILLVFLLFTLMPLVSTFSKHALMTGAVILAFLLDNLPLPAWLKKCGWLPIVVLGLVCETTVLFVTFPLSAHAPFINTSSGMYAIHQIIYAKTGLHSLGNALLGCSPAEIHQLYPQLADIATIKATLTQYNAMGNFTMFSTFMDPHNEYLNLLAFYGLPVVCLFIAFFIALARRPQLPRMALYLLIALAFCCLWDDLLSKRWIWAALAISMPQSEPQCDC